MRARLRRIALGACVALLLATSVAHAHPGVEATLAKLDTLIAANPTVQALWIRRGAVLAEHGDTEPALRDLRHAETLGDPVNVAYDLGVVQYRLREYDAARASLGRYLTAHPGNVQALLYRARAARDAGDTAAALVDLRAYLYRAETPNPAEYLVAAKLLTVAPDADVTPAIDLLDEGLAKLGQVPLLQRHAVELELRRGRTDNALRRWESLRAITRESPYWRLVMAELLLRAGRRAEADALLVAADAELAREKPTPARLEMRVRIANLRRGRGSDTSAASAPGTVDLD